MSLEQLARFAEAPDREDYAASALRLADDCEYQSGDETLRGPTAILERIGVKR
ncbi:MAG: hypothetical protein KC609_25050 [Myxococcales bacterium]|nr:hypothetical protein [Myxococcales bacterium]